MLPIAVETEVPCLRRLRQRRRRAGRIGGAEVRGVLLVSNGAAPSAVATTPLFMRRRVHPLAVEGSTHGRLVTFMDDGQRPDVGATRKGRVVAVVLTAAVGARRRGAISGPGAEAGPDESVVLPLGPSRLPEDTRLDVLVSIVGRIQGVARPPVIFTTVGGPPPGLTTTVDTLPHLNAEVPLKSVLATLTRPRQGVRRLNVLFRVVAGGPRALL